MKKIIFFLGVAGILFSTAMSQTITVFHENFELLGQADSVTAYSGLPPSPSWVINSSLHAQGQYSISCQVQTGRICYLTTNAFNTVGMTSVYLCFSQICKCDFGDKAIIEVSADSGLTWTPLTGMMYMGIGAYSTNGNSFSSNSYGALWQPANAAAIPSNSWWRNEQFDCTALLANSPNALIRFILKDLGPSGAMGNYGWCIDNIKVNNYNSTCSGLAFEDVNSNCIYDSGDIARPSVPIELLCVGQSSSIYYTNNQGYFYIFVPDTINYSVKVSNLAGTWGFSVVCPASGQYTITSLPSSGNDFGLYCLPGFDLQVYTHGWRFKPGHISYLIPNIMNYYCTPISGQVKLVLDDPLLTYSSATPAPDTIIGDTLLWNYSNLSNFTFWSWWLNEISTVRVMTSTSAVIGDTVCVTTIITPVTGDVNPVNNVSTRCWIVSNSYDPNEKSVEPRGTGPQGLVMPNTSFTYTIDFQNTGNTTATNISILDTLNPHLDINTFTPISCSHPMQVEILAGNILRFKFLNINLPDSNANEPLSHGWVSYQVSALPSLPDGTIITNKAGIYFDLNPVVATNTSLNTIDSHVGILILSTGKAMDLQVYPNPAREQINIRTRSEMMNSTLKVINLLGQEMFRLQGLYGNTVTIDTKGFAGGLYFLLLRNGNKQISGKFIIEK